MRFELTTPTLARLCSTPELRPLERLMICYQRGVYAPRHLGLQGQIHTESVKSENRLRAFTKKFSHLAEAVIRVANGPFLLHCWMIGDGNLQPHAQRPHVRFTHRTRHKK